MSDKVVMRDEQSKSLVGNTIVDAWWEAWEATYLHLKLSDGRMVVIKGDLEDAKIVEVGE